MYIDAFAGSGTRTEVRRALPLFSEGATEDEEIDTPGSARIALSIDPPFDLVALIEEDREKCDELEKLKLEFPDRQIVVRHGDANSYVRQICSALRWHRPSGSLLGMRGVIFLDPFGMEVEWSTVEAIAATHALDCWYFFPLSGLYRNAPHNPAKLDPHKEASLDRVLGASDWRTRWYDHPVEPLTLFETKTQAVRRADVDAIEGYVKERLETVFEGLVMEPYRLNHNGGAPLASLFFAVSNPQTKAVDLARRIVSYILK